MKEVTNHVPICAHLWPHGASLSEVVMTQVSFTSPVAMRSSPARGGFLSGRAWACLLPPADGVGFPIGSDRFPSAIMLTAVV